MPGELSRLIYQTRPPGSPLEGQAPAQEAHQPPSGMAYVAGFPRGQYSEHSPQYGNFCGSVHICTSVNDEGGQLPALEASSQGAGSLKPARWIRTEVFTPRKDPFEAVRASTPRSALERSC